MSDQSFSDQKNSSSTSPSNEPLAQTNLSPITTPVHSPPSISQQQRTTSTLDAPSPASCTSMPPLTQQLITPSETSPQLANPSDVNAIVWADRTLLALTCEVGNIHVVRDLLMNGAEVNQKNCKWPPLVGASLYGHLEIVQVLIGHGADVNIRGCDGETALMMASLYGHLEIAKLFIQNGAEVNLQDNDGETALIMASRNSEVVQLMGMLKSMGTVSLVPKVDYNGGHTRIAGLLIDHGAKVNLQDHNGETALMKASGCGQLKLTLLLINHDAEVNLQDNNGETALMKVNYENPLRCPAELTKLLIESGADVNLCNNKAESALMKVCKNPINIEVAQVLIHNGALVNLQDDNGETALMRASSSGDISLAKLLLINGADANLRSNNGLTALHHYFGREEMFEFLLPPSVPQFVERLQPVAHKWRDLGEKLSIVKDNLDSFQTTIEEDNGRLQEVMTSWSDRFYPKPTWWELIEAVTSVDESIGTQIKDELESIPFYDMIFGDSRYDGFNSEEDIEENSGDEANSDNSGDEANSDEISEEEHLAAVQQAMKIKGVLEHILAHGVLVGPAGSGKSSLMSRLVCEMPSSTSASTGVANRVVQVEVRRSSSVAVSAFSDSVWLKILFDKEAIRLVTQLTSFLSPQTIEQTHPLSTSSDAGEEKHEQTKPQLQTPTISFQNTQDYSSSVPDRSGTTASNRQLTYPSGYIVPVKVFQNSLCQGHLKQLQAHFKNSWTLYLTDTGGQMEFQEVLPLLVSGPSIFFITFRLDQDLKQQFTIEYRLPDGGRSEPYESSLSLEEAILQTLASVASMGTFTYKGSDMKSVPLKPKVLIIGTHKDKLDPTTAESKIREIDTYLQKVIKSTAHYHEDLVVFSSESQLIFTVNNLSEDDSDFKKIRSSVERVVHHPSFKMDYPSHWLIFSLVLRQKMIKDSIISYDQCFAIAQDCGITSHEELDHVLWFLHTKVGLIRHFPTTGLKDVVIRDPQVLFDQATNLIVKTFTFENVSERRSSEFKKRGIFSFEDFKSAIESSSQLLPPEKLLLLLEQLRIVAPFQTDEGETKYFLPCVLAKSEKCSSPVSTSATPPLLITFKCGYLPKGLAGALIVYLLTNQMQGPKFKWKLKTDQIFRDQVSFLVSPCDFVTLKIHPTFLECVHQSALAKSKLRQTEAYAAESVCDRVRFFIIEGIKKVSSELNFTSDADHAVTFYCENSACVQSNGPHPATNCHDISVEDELFLSLSCERSQEVVVSDAPPGCSIWFGQKDNHIQSNPVAAAIDKSHCVDSDLSCSARKRFKSSSSQSSHDAHLSVTGVDVDPPVECITETRLGEEERQINEGDWATICGYLYMLDCPQIRRLGGELGLSVYRLEKMKDLPDDMVKAWIRKEDRVLEKCDETLTWDVLVDALNRIGQKGVADTIFKAKLC